MHDSASVSADLSRLIRTAIARNGGWLPFDRFMAMALYAPGLGYYANRSRKFGTLPESGSDFVTAPELSPLFGRALARQVAQAFQASGTREVWEFGAGSGALAEQLLDALDTIGQAVQRYTIVDLSGTLRERQRERLAAHGAKVQWVDALPEHMAGLIVGNEVLDAMPVELVVWREETTWICGRSMRCISSNTARAAACGFHPRSPTRSAGMRRRARASASSGPCA